jgi:hypothetical protein
VAPRAKAKEKNGQRDGVQLRQHVEEEGGSDTASREVTGGGGPAVAWEQWTRGVVGDP